MSAERTRMLDLGASVRLRSLDKQLADRMEELEAVDQQLGQTLGPIEQVRLRRLRNVLLDEIEQVESKFQELQQGADGRGRQDIDLDLRLPRTDSQVVVEAPADLDRQRVVFPQEDGSPDERLMLRTKPEEAKPVAEQPFSWNFLGQLREIEKNLHRLDDAFAQCRRATDKEILSGQLVDVFQGWTESRRHYVVVHVALTRLQDADRIRWQTELDQFEQAHTTLDDSLADLALFRISRALENFALKIIALEVAVAHDFDDRLQQLLRTDTAGSEALSQGTLGVRNLEVKLRDLATAFRGCEQASYSGQEKGMLTSRGYATVDETWRASQKALVTFQAIVQKVESGDSDFNTSVDRLKNSGTVLHQAICDQALRTIPKHVESFAMALYELQAKVTAQLDFRLALLKPGTLN